MAADMVALVTSLYIRHFFPRVLEPTFTAHLAVPSLPVPTYRHLRDLKGSPQYSARLLGNVMRWMFVDERSGVVVCAGESKQDYRWV
jgi:alkylated DNA nucleotide flippase Atl1